MITGKLTTYRTTCGGLLHKGWCKVTDESVSPLDVLGPQVPDPQAGYVRESIELRTNKARSVGTVRVFDRKK